jgi:hypothetical protein
MGVEVFKLMNELIQLRAVPTLGGRLMSLRVGEREFFYRNRALLDGDLHPVIPLNLLPPADETLGSWHNFGGDKTWPAPQGWETQEQWHGPPDVILDAGPYSASYNAQAEQITLTMQSMPDWRTGLRITRSIQLVAGLPGFKLVQTFENVVDRQISWALWDVAQLDAQSIIGCASLPVGMYVGIERDSPLPVRELFSVTGNVSWERLTANVIHVPVQDVVGKLGFVSAVGWLAFRAEDGMTLVQQFTPEPDAVYPDGGARAEIWLQYPVEKPLVELGNYRPLAHVIESEVLGPLTRLAPGGKSQLTVNWRVTRTAGPILDVVPAGCVYQPLQVFASLTLPRTHIVGGLGPFVAGTVRGSWRSASGDILSEVDLATGRLLNCVDLDIWLDRPLEATTLTVYLLGTAGATWLWQQIALDPHSNLWNS